MEPVEWHALEKRARRAYEWGRLRQSLGQCWALLPVLALMLLSCGLPTLAWLSGLALLLGATGLWWRGQAYARAVAPGLGAGLVPLSVALVAPALGRLGAPLTCWQGCVTLCVAAGGLAGVLVGSRAAQQGRNRRRFLLSAGGIAILVGAPGCVFAGAAGVLGMLVGLTAVGTPLAHRPSPVAH